MYAITNRLAALLRSRRNQAGSTAVEYVLIVVSIMVAATMLVAAQHAMAHKYQCTQAVVEAPVPTVSADCR